MNPIVRFDLNLLFALDALLSERHVTRAAERLYVTQPAMSGMLQRLRGQFEDELLIRVGRELKLTAKAEALWPRLKESLRTIRELLATEPKFEAGTASRVFKIIMSDYCEYIFLPHVMAYLGKYAPGIQCQIESLSSATFAQIESGEVDLCITADNWPLLGLRYTDNLVSVPVFVDEMMCITSEAGSGGAVLSEEEFRTRRHAILRTGRNTQSVEEAALRAAGIEIESSVESPSLTSMVALVAATPLIATVPKRLAIKLGTPLGIKIYQPPFAIPPLTEAMTWHIRNDGDPGHQWFRSAMIDCARNL